MSQDPGAVCVFPLSRMVFFPKTSKPLKIFEPRYVQMIYDCLDRDLRVALAYSDLNVKNKREMPEPESYIRPICGIGKVHLLEKKRDGTLLILLEGSERVRLREYLKTDAPYLTATYHSLAELSEIREENVFFMNRVVQSFEDWLARSAVENSYLNRFISNLDQDVQLLEYFCTFVIKDSEKQQQLLEIDDVNERIVLLRELFSQFPDKLRLAQQS